MNDVEMFKTLKVISDAAKDVVPNIKTDDEEIGLLQFLAKLENDISDKDVEGMTPVQAYKLAITDVALFVMEKEGF